MTGELAAGPLVTAIAIGLSILIFARLLRRIMAVFVTVYVLIGCATYLYWIYAEAGPPHGNFVPSFASIGDILWQVAVALAAILGWPVWPIIRTIVLDI